MLTILPILMSEAGIISIVSICIPAGVAIIIAIIMMIEELF